MKSKNILTGERKIMNMQKLGIVVQSISLQEKVLTPRQYRAFNMTRYTLCEYQGRPSR
jgi:hypothetical protein